MRTRQEGAIQTDVASVLTDTLWSALENSLVAITLSPGLSPAKRERGDKMQSVKEGKGDGKGE